MVSLTKGDVSRPPQWAYSSMAGPLQTGPNKTSQGRGWTLVRQVYIFQTPLLNSLWEMRDGKREEGVLFRSECEQVWGRIVIIVFFDILLLLDVIMWGFLLEVAGNFRGFNSLLFPRAFLRVLVGTLWNDCGLHRTWLTSRVVSRWFYPRSLNWPPTSFSNRILFGIS